MLVSGLCIIGRFLSIAAKGTFRPWIKRKCQDASPADSKLPSSISVSHKTLNSRYSICLVGNLRP